MGDDRTIPPVRLGEGEEVGGGLACGGGPVARLWAVAHVVEGKGAQWRGGLAWWGVVGLDCQTKLVVAGICPDKQVGWDQQLIKEKEKWNLIGFQMSLDP